MTIEKIRKNAPEGATHYRLDWDGDPVYYRFKNDSMSLWMDEDGWQPSSLATGNTLLQPI